MRSNDGGLIKIMEVCGTHTSAIFRHGVRSLISPQIRLISGPGCPVCVTSAAYIDRLVEYSLTNGFCVLSFGDMFKVRGTGKSLAEAKADGANVRLMYSPLPAVQLAAENPNITYIIAAVGFETTAPVYALLMEEIISKGIHNIKLLTSVKKILPAMAYILDNDDGIDGFLCPGHVSVITGSGAYRDLAEKYRKPFVVAGFEGAQILSAIDRLASQIKSKRCGVDNLYPSAVSEAGNARARMMMDKYFETDDADWRGIGNIGSSALVIRQAFAGLDAGSRLLTEEEKPIPGCRCTDVILGRIPPNECPLFGRACTPSNAVGPCMVSAEGACGIWYENGGTAYEN